MKAATRIPPSPLPPDADRRLRRLRSLAWLLDRSIPIGGGRRIGLDPVLGLLPGAGDWVAAILSLYVLYQSARLGLPFRVLLQMAGNIVVEAVVGTVPIAGDIFDAVWQANMRNVRLIDRHYRPTLQPRSLRRMWVAFGIFALALLTLIGLAIYGVISLIVGLLG